MFTFFIPWNDWHNWVDLHNCIINTSTNLLG